MLRWRMSLGMLIKLSRCFWEDMRLLWFVLWDSAPVDMHESKFETKCRCAVYGRW